MVQLCSWNYKWNIIILSVFHYYRARGCLGCTRYRASLWENRSLGFPTRSDTNRAVQPQKMARGLKFRIYKVEGLYYLCSENKDADQLRSYCAADLCLCFRIWKSWFSHNAAHIDSRTQHILSWRFGHESLSMTILPVLLIQEEQLTVNGKSMYTKYCLTAPVWLA